MTDGEHKSESYKKDGNIDCLHLDTNDPEDPCWGKVEFVDVDEWVDEEGNYEHATIGSACLLKFRSYLINHRV